MTQLPSPRHDENSLTAPGIDLEKLKSDLKHAISVTDTDLQTLRNLIETYTLEYNTNLQKLSQLNAAFDALTTPNEPKPSKDVITHKKETVLAALSNHPTSIHDISKLTKIYYNLVSTLLNTLKREGKCKFEYKRLNKRGSPTKLWTLTP